MTDVLKDQAGIANHLLAANAPARDLIFVLLYDANYMAHSEAHPAYIMTDKYVRDTKTFNEEIKHVILEHSGLSNYHVVFYQEPELFISDLVQNREEVLGVLNFCDDYADRSHLFSIPGLFDLFQLPFSGYSLKNLNLNHNKFYSFSIARQLGINVPETYFCTKDNLHDLKINNFPVFLKPNNAGGSEGIGFQNLVFSQNQLEDFGQKMLNSFEELVVQEYLPGDEVTLGLVRRCDEINVLTPRLMQFKNFPTNEARIFSYDFKWDHSLIGTRELLLSEYNPSEVLKKKVIQDSIMLFKMLEAKDFARVDWKFDKNGELKFIDFNEQPNFSETSVLNWCMVHSGWTRRDIIFAVIDNLLQSIETRKI